MKKFFTLISMALFAMSVNAQDKYVVVDADGNVAPEFASPVADGTALVVNVSTANVTMKAVASRTPTDIEDASGAGLNQDTWTSWADANWNTVKNQGDINFWWIQGTGNPYISFVSEQKSRDGELLDAYKAKYTLYEPDGSLGLPNSGEYLEITAKADGMFKVGFWANKNSSRKLYLVDKETKKALQWNEDENATQYKVEGYVNGCDENYIENGEKKARKRYLTYMPVVDYVIGSTDFVNDKVLDDDNNPTTKTVNLQNQPKFAWFVFDAKANNTYMIFGSDWQFGIQGFEFTAGATIANYHAQDPNSTASIREVTNVAESVKSPRYNLAGQKVSKDFKGVVLQNGKKFVQK